MENKQRPLILVSNDDSIYAKGIKSLIEVAKEYGDVIIVAPDKPQSAKSHSVTLDVPLFCKKVDNFEGVEAYKCSGTPADCIKIALHEILDRKPDLIISGINHGSNSSVNVIYSGTLAATIEGCLHGIPSIGFSLLSYDPDADFQASKIYASKIIKQTLSNDLDNGTCLNVNIPNLKYDNINGIQICKQTKGVWAEEFNKRKHPTRDINYFWLTGKYINLEPNSTDTDIYALENGYVAVVPIQIDLTAYQSIEKIKKWNF